MSHVPLWARSARVGGHVEIELGEQGPDLVLAEGDRAGRGRIQIERQAVERPDGQTAPRRQEPARVHRFLRLHAGEPGFGQQDVTVLPTVRLLQLCVEQAPDLGLRRPARHVPTAEQRRGVGRGHRQAGRRPVHETRERRRGGLNASDAGRVAEAALGRAPDPIRVPDLQLVGEEPEELAGLGVQARRQRQQVVHRRHLDERRRRIGGLRRHRLHRVDAGVVVAVPVRDDANQLRIDGERRTCFGAVVTGS